MHLLVQQGESEGVRVVTGHWSRWERERFEIRRDEWQVGDWQRNGGAPLVPLPP